MSKISSSLNTIENPTEKFTGRVVNCFDSHVHWQATGTFNNRIQLHDLCRSSDFETFLRARPVPPGACYADKDNRWWTGFGWDQNQPRSESTPSSRTKLDHEVLDRVYGDDPVFFVRIDGHAAWVNKAALRRAGLWMKNPASPTGGEIQLKDDGYPSGILLDHAMQIVERLLPLRTKVQIREDLLYGQNIFHAAGFTHIRDLSGDELQWQVTNELIAENKIALAVEQFFGAEDPQLFDRQLDLATRLKRENDVRMKATGRTGWQPPNGLIRPLGVKIFLDGALGSEGALLSCDYCQRQGHRGLQLLDVATLRDFITRAWRAGLPLACHAIGDAAAHVLATTAFEVQESGVRGELHIEHAELLRGETIQILKNLHKVVCYMQPCHWLTDRDWLSAKIGALSNRAFRWRELEDNNISVFFGSDAPIDIPSLSSNSRAIREAAKTADIPLPKNPAWFYQSHPDTGWTPSTFTSFTDDQVLETQFLGRKLF